MLADILSEEPEHEDEAPEGGQGDRVARHRDNLPTPEPETHVRSNIVTFHFYKYDLPALGPISQAPMKAQTAPHRWTTPLPA